MKATPNWSIGAAIGRRSGRMLRVGSGMTRPHVITTAWVTVMPGRLCGCTAGVCCDQPSKPRAHPNVPSPAAAQLGQAIAAGRELIRLPRRGRGQQTRAVRTFEELVTEGSQVPVDGWDFSWLEGRATEKRPRRSRLGSRG